MNANDFGASIRTAASFLEGMGLLGSIVYPVTLPKSEQFNKLALTSSDYDKIYEFALAHSHYNLLLVDLAFFQFSRKSEDEWALAYYPNPRVTGSSDAWIAFKDLCDERENESISDEDFSELAASMPKGYYVPRIRFEYSASQYIPVKHPAAHFHIGMSGEDRWALGRKLSPASFSMLVCKYYYPESWWKKSRFSLPIAQQAAEHVVASCVDECLVRTLQSDGVSLHFEDVERIGLHFSALQGR